MYHGQTVSVVFSTYREKASIRRFIDACFDTGFVDEVVVVDNNAEEGTLDEVRKTRARWIVEPRQGYGHGYRKALTEATGDLVIMTEADGTFLPSDFEKLLTYANDFPVVFCTRTATYTILEGANMGLFLKWGNWSVAKMIEVLYGATQLSDVGCTTRLIRRDVLQRLSPFFSVGESHFGLEMMLLAILADVPFIEIPIHYLPRVGESAVTGDLGKTWRLGLTMIGHALRTRLDWKLRTRLLEVGAQARASRTP